MSKLDDVFDVVFVTIVVVGVAMLVKYIYSLII